MYKSVLKEVMHFKDYKKKYRKVAIGWSITSVAATVLFPLCMYAMLEYAIPNSNRNLVITLGISYFFINILRAISTFYEDLNHESVVREMAADYREELYSKLQKVKQSYLDKVKAGEILECMINDTLQIGRYFPDGIAMVYYGGLFRFTATLLILLCINIKLLLITLLLYGIGLIVTQIFNKKSLAYTEMKRKVNAQILNWSNEEIEGFQTIKCLTLEKQRYDELKDLLSKYDEATKRLDRNIRRYTFYYEFIVSMVGVINILVGGLDLTQGIITYGSLMFILRNVSHLEGYAKWLVKGYQIRNVSRISYEKVKQILEAGEEKEEEGETLEKITTIDFEKIHFSYEGKEDVIEDFSLKIGEKQNVAFIGKTGSGKTSLVNLLCRFYEIQEGRILVNGQDYKKYSIESLRERIGYVMQQVVLFEGTVLENINYATEKVDKVQIVQICKELQLHDKIMQLPNGYETKLVPDTDILSVGEKQLLNFARVMLQNPDVVILDEVTASLSYHSEMLIRDAIEKITQNRISFIIAHRLSTIQRCDKIVLLQKGRVIEEGNHEQLMKLHGKYYEVIGKQYA